MKRFITDKKRKVYLSLSIAFWVLIWWAMSAIINEKLFLPSPFSVFKALMSLFPEKEFWTSIAFSTSRVVLSYLISFIVAALLGVFGGLSERFEILLSPLVKAMRSIPVASIVILVLLWVKSRNLSTVVSFLVVFPILYESVLSGVKNTDPLLLEAADNYRIRGYRRLRYIYLPSISPYIESGIKSSLGLCWKSAVAAEVIGLPLHSMGSKLYEAKVYLDTPSLFAWTLVIVVLAALFEKLAFLLFSIIKRRVMR